MKNGKYNNGLCVWNLIFSAFYRRRGMLCIFHWHHSDALHPLQILSSSPMFHLLQSINREIEWHLCDIIIVAKYYGIYFFFFCLIVPTYHTFSKKLCLHPFLCWYQCNLMKQNIKMYDNSEEFKISKYWFITRKQDDIMVF